MTARKNPEDKKRAGRKTAFKPEFVELAYNYSLLGATDIEMAGFFGVSEKTFNTWKKQYPEFLQSLKKGKVIADGEVASKLYHRALGYSHSATKFATADGKITDQVQYTEHYPPDTTAAIFWLKNRQPEKWRDRTETNLTGDLVLKSELEKLSDTELENIVNNGSIDHNEQGGNNDKA
ncbi:MAG: hypothetical protein AB2L20_14800 [Mangrovibacterium sp.]